MCKSSPVGATDAMDHGSRTARRWCPPRQNKLDLKKEKKWSMAPTSSPVPREYRNRPPAPPNNALRLESESPGKSGCFTNAVLHGLINLKGRSSVPTIALWVSLV